MAQIKQALSLTLANRMQKADELARRLDATEEEVMVLGQSLREAEAAQLNATSTAQQEQVLPVRQPLSLRHWTISGFS